MMKTNDIKILALLMLLLSSCTGEEPAAQGYGTIHFSLEDCKDTRSSTASETFEYAINSLQVIVADSNGRIEYCRELGGSGNIDIPARPGEKTVLAIANGPSLGSCSTLDQVLGTELDLTRWNSAANGFAMSGQRQCRVAVDSISVLPMQLARYVSRVRFVQVTNRLPAAYGRLTITGVLLSNAAGNQTVSGDAPTLTWHNAAGIADSRDLPTILGEKADQQLSANVTYRIGTKMYCYPNSSAICTRAVLSAEIQGREYYYPINLPQLERNTSYDITLSVYHPGSTDPDIPVCPGYIRVNVSAGQWTEGPGITENL